MVRRAPGQVSGSLTRPDLSCGATFLPEDLTFAPLVLSLRTGDRGFESLHRQVHCEPDFLDQDAENFMRYQFERHPKEYRRRCAVGSGRAKDHAHLFDHRERDERIPFPPSGESGANLTFDANLVARRLSVLAPIVGAIIVAIVHMGLSVLTHERFTAAAAPAE